MAIRPPLRRTLVASALGAFIVPTTAQAETHFNMQVETVNNYTGPFCNSPLSGSNASGQGFLNQIQHVGPNDVNFQLQVGSQRQDANVWDTDFLDPNLINCPDPTTAEDDLRWDAPGLGISFYQGHGADMSGDETSIVCQNEQGCPASSAPPGTTVGLSGYGTCSMSPMDSGNCSGCRNLGPGKGHCIYTQSNTVNPTLDLCGSFAGNNNHAQLGFMALGETPAVGNWRGASTNGGTSVALVHMSYGALSFFPFSSWASAFAGLHLYGGIMNVYDDVADDSSWGPDIASSYTSNPFGQVSQAYQNALAMSTQGSGCIGSGSVTGGFNGCGCHVMITVSDSSSNAQAAMQETWWGVPNDWTNQTSSAYGWYVYECNYNVSQYPWLGGD